MVKCNEIQILNPENDSQVPVAQKTVHANNAVAPSDLCDSLKQEHDVAKVVKVDDLAVPVHYGTRSSSEVFPLLLRRRF
jgi:hypothetical protein